MRPSRGFPAAPCLLALLTGCSFSIPVTRPMPSGPSFADAAAGKVTLRVVDARAGQETTFHVTTAALKGATVRLDGMDAPVARLAENLGAEFAGRGYPVKVITDPATPADVELRVTRYRIVSRQLGIGPWEAMHEFGGTVRAGATEHRLFAYFFAHKLPVGEQSVVEPCFNLPQSVLVKEVASKVNHLALGYRSTDAVVDELTRRARSKDDVERGPWLELVELAGTNNPRAMEVLKQYAAHRDEFVRAVAFDAIGILGPEKEVGFLKDRFASSSLGRQDRYMALKAVGDAGDAESLKFVGYQTSHKDYEDEAGLKYLVDLYAGR